MLTASYTDVRKDFAAITAKVMKDRVPITVFKNNKPAFRIVPVQESASTQDEYLAEAHALDQEYYDVFEALAHEK